MPLVQYEQREVTVVKEAIVTITANATLASVILETLRNTLGLSLIPGADELMQELKAIQRSDSTFPRFGATNDSGSGLRIKFAPVVERQI
ncbi:hypothetical protein [Roseateles sp.]|uniref:hypothetical protein n=1 Tax=Roseateles sp. TaxID=1971397 RepID=UPI00286AA7B4|nr:hypothetical protein [Roseateles sp.]